MDAIAIRLRVFVLLPVFVVALGTVGFTLIEHLSLVDSLYLTIVTVATVGYGDLAPVTSAGKILAIVLILGGTGSFLGVFSGLFEATFSRREKTARLQNLHLVIGVVFSEIGTLPYRSVRASPIFSGLRSTSPRNWGCALTLRDSLRRMGRIWRVTRPGCTGCWCRPGWPT